MATPERRIDQHILDEIITAVERLKHGQVVITVYDSQVVQIEETKKKRFSQEKRQKETL